MKRFPFRYDDKIEKDLKLVKDRLFFDCTSKNKILGTAVRLLAQIVENLPDEYLTRTITQTRDFIKLKYQIDFTRTFDEN